MATLDREEVRRRFQRATGIAGRIRQGALAVLDARTLGRLALSFLLAFGLWAYVTVRNNPDTTRLLPAYPIELRGLPDGVVSMTDLPRVDVTIAGPAVLVQEPSRPVQAYIDVSDIAPGASQPVGIDVDAPRGVRVVSTNPGEVVITLEPLVTKTFPVELSFSTTVAGVRMTEPTVEPSSVNITAPRSVIEQISRVVVRPEFGVGATDLTQIIRPVPLDKSSTEVTHPYLSIEPRTVTVTLPSRSLTGSMSVPIRPMVEGQPAAGYQIDSIQARPAVITIEGDAGTLQNLSSIETEPITITNRTESLTRDVPLRLPEGVRASTTTVQVAVDISPVRARMRLALVAAPRGLAAGLRATIQPSSVDVVLEGPVPTIQRADVGAIRAEVNLSGLGPGTYQVRPEIVGAGLDQVRVTDVQPTRVTVTVAPEPTPTVPAPTPTPSPTG